MVLRLDAIRESLRERGMAPTHTEPAKAMGLSNTSAVNGHLAALTRISEATCRELCGSDRQRCDQTVWDREWRRLTGDKHS